MIPKVVIPAVPPMYESLIAPHPNIKIFLILAILVGVLHYLLWA